MPSRLHPLAEIVPSPLDEKLSSPVSPWARCHLEKTSDTHAAEPTDEPWSTDRLPGAQQCPTHHTDEYINICDTVAPIITMMCNASISQSRFPHCHKSAIVRPLLKKTNLDPLDLNSYRPIPNLSYVSKLLEQFIDSRITEHANVNNYYVL